MTPNDLPIREPDQIRIDCAKKLTTVQISDYFLAILGCLLGEDWTTPRLLEMMILPKGHMIGCSEGQPGFSTVLGAAYEHSLHEICSVIAQIAVMSTIG